MLGTEIVMPVVTLFWAAIGGILPWFIPDGPNKGIIQTMIILTAVCCYLHWLLTYLVQLNPLIGPELLNYTALYLERTWG